MRSFFEWFTATGIRTDRPWLVFGKGPSFARRGEFDLAPYHSISLNHAVREQQVDIAHIIDADVVDHLGEDLWRNAGHVVMPWRPHVKNDPGPDHLELMAQRHPLLRRLDEAGRLLWYNLSSGKPRPGSPIVVARYFSAEAAIHLLAQCGVRTIRSLGIDGGAAYSAAFHDLNDKTLLANGRPSFDKQFEQIARTIATTGIDFAPLDVPSPLVACIRASKAQALPATVLAGSLRRRTSMTTAVHIVPTEVAAPDHAQRVRQLLAIAAVRHHRGRAVCLDATMVVLRDLRPLWYLPAREAAALGIHSPDNATQPDLAVALLDCAAATDSAKATQWHADIAPGWHAIDHHDEATTCILDYAKEAMQPWTARNHPLARLWCQELLASIAAGDISRADVVTAVQRRQVRPSLLAQVDQRLIDPLALPSSAVRLDRGYVSPTGVVVPQPPAQPLAALRSAWQRNGLRQLTGRLRNGLARLLGRAPYA